MKRAFFVAVGSELLNCKINRYSIILSEKLRKEGITLIGEITSPDISNMIIKSIKFASENSELIIIIGGLGPTFDDLTRKSLSELLCIPLVYSKKVEKFLSFRFKDTIKYPNLINQCYVLKGARLIENYNGTAFGQIIKKNRKTYILLPGPYSEWEPMWEKIKGYIKSNRKIFFHRFKIAEMKEIEVENVLRSVIQKYTNLNYTILAGADICEFSLISQDSKQFLKAKAEIEKILSEFIYGEGEDSLELKTAEILKTKKLTLSTAESCTGGLLASTLTDVPGSSVYYTGGINAYSNEIKIKILKVSQNTIKRYGAVSEQTVKEMALNVKKIFKTDCSIAISGIAGPGGGTPDKPVGTVFIASSFKNKIKIIKRFYPYKSRSFVKKASVNAALWNLYKMLKYS